MTTDQAAVAAHLADTVVAAINGRPEPAACLTGVVHVVRRDST